jgi:hypothetical protein
MHVFSATSREIANRAIDKTPKPSKIRNRHRRRLRGIGSAVTSTGKSFDSVTAIPFGELVGHYPIFVNRREC